MRAISRAFVPSVIDEAWAEDAYTLEGIGTDEVRVVMGSVDFAAWLAWVERLQVQQIRLGSGRIEPLSRPGLVSANAVFVRGR